MKLRQIRKTGNEQEKPKGKIKGREGLAEGE